jgi:uncharacterized protein (UPF0248 family)
MFEKSANYRHLYRFYPCNVHSDCTFRDNGRIWHVDAIVKSILKKAMKHHYSDDNTCYIIRADGLASCSDKKSAVMDSVASAESTPLYSDSSSIASVLRYLYSMT